LVLLENPVTRKEVRLRNPGWKEGYEWLLMRYRTTDIGSCGDVPV
jgi:hypothetical protein